MLPARAGVSPGRGGKDNLQGRTSRTRGGGPRQNSDAGQYFPCFPHAQGWAHPADGLLSNSRMFPACAGVGLRNVICDEICAGASRTRGGGSSGQPASMAEQTCFPYTRGWASSNLRKPTVTEHFPHTREWLLRSRSFSQRTITFPARAGVGPLVRTKNEIKKRFPHTRGWVRSK